MKSGFRMPTGPPEAPCVEKWLMLGISTPSRKKRFSEGPPPRTIRSLRKAAVEATPGKVWMTREMSRLPPALLKAYDAQAQRALGGLTERGGDDVHLLDALARLLQLDRDKDILVGNLKLGRDERLVTDKA